jgi:drug/metabolite transporter (DMT)-like permease
LAPPRYLIPYILITAFQYVFAKDALGYASPLVYGALTTLLTSIALFSVSKGFRPILNRDTLLFSLFYWLSGVSWLVGLNYISSSQSAVISFTMPLFAIPLAILVLGERGSRAEVYGAVIGFGGIVVFNIPLLTGGTTVIGVALTLSDAFFWALFSVFMRRLRDQDAPRTLATATFVAFLLYGAFSFTDFSVRPTVQLAADVGFLGIVAGAFNFYLWMALIRIEKVGKLTTVIFLAPVITLIYTVATTRAIPSYITLTGVALIFLGIYAANIMRPAETPASPPGPSPVLGHGS